MNAIDLIVRTANPDLLDRTVQQLGPAVVVDGTWNGDTCHVRVFGDPGYFKFAITQQGYGEITGEVPVAHTQDYEIDQASWPAHLRDDAPSQRCSSCGRNTWAVEEFGNECRMTQPSGQACGGRFGA